MSKKRWFRAHFAQVSTINFSAIRNRVHTEHPEVLEQCINTALKNSMMMTMMAFGKSPHVFHFKPTSQNREVLGEKLWPLSNRLDCAPLAFLKLAFRMTGSKEVFMSADFGVVSSTRDSFIGL
jgi:hypothetical protein